MNPFDVYDEALRLFSLPRHIPPGKWKAEPRFTVNEMAALMGIDQNDKVLRKAHHWGTRASYRLPTEGFN